MRTSKPKNFRKWLKALRSGEYKQGRDSLLRRGRYCCLGVACDVAGYDLEKLSTDDRRTDFLPKSVRIFLGLRPIDANVPVSASFSFEGIARHNDRGLSFPKIADLLEAKYLK